MFKLQLFVSVANLDGLAALDERRRLKLPDEAGLRTGENSERSVTVAVPESFAREFPHLFGDADFAEHEIALGDFAAGDVVPLGPSSYAVGLNQNMTPERVMDLMRFDRRIYLEGEVAELTARLAAAGGLTDRSAEVAAAVLEAFRENASYEDYKEHGGFTDAEYDRLLAELRARA